MHTRCTSPSHVDLLIKCNFSFAMALKDTVCALKSQ